MLLTQEWDRKAWLVVQDQIERVPGRDGNAKQKRTHDDGSITWLIIYSWTPERPVMLEHQRVREGKVLKVLLSGRWIPRNQG